ncbi:hypothetical protein [Terricaulis sp.]|uniref:hypothetical protein n=1 Tax=Terricaulis sp. TaxID=2768686 RepID=UPI00378378D4
MTAVRGWAIATLVAGVAALAMFVAFARLSEMQAAAQCLPAGSVVQFELAENTDQLETIFGAAGSECRALTVPAMDAVNRLDLIAFIPIYTLFCIFGALYIAGGGLRPLSVAAIGAALIAAGGDYLETTTLLKITQHIDAPGQLLKMSTLGAWTKFALLAAHAFFCAGLCFTAEKRRPILGVLLVLPAFGTAAAAYNHLTLANAMNGAFALAWVGLLVFAAISVFKRA